MLNFITQLLSAFFPSKVMYIGGSDILPPPLSGAEEQQLLAQAAAGSDAARQKLIERNLRLVVYIARRFENTGINIEDLISIGTIGLIKGSPARTPRYPSTSRSTPTGTATSCCCRTSSAPTAIP